MRDINQYTITKAALEHPLATNDDKPAGCAQGTVSGPFEAGGARHFANGDDLANHVIGTPCRVWVTVKAQNGEAEAGAVIEAWPVDTRGSNAVQYTGLDKAQARSVRKSVADGFFYFRTIVSDSFDNTTGGAVGELLHAVGCHPRWPAHLHFVIEAVSYKKHDRRCVPQRRPALRFRRCRGVRESAAGDGLPKPDGNYTLHFEFVVNPGK
jgi:hydroxyquinol 1,2-dioxygenase